MQNDSWHRRLYDFSYTVFSVEPKADPKPLVYALTVGLAAAYLAFAGIVFVLLNLGTLPFGVYSEPIWRPEPRSIFLKLPGGVPIIAVAVGLYALLLAIVITAENGIWAFVGPFLVLGAVLLAIYAGLVGLAILNAGLARRTTAASERSGPPTAGA